MKKALILLCMAALTGNAQPYGEKLYPHPGTFCSSGLNTIINPPGFITSGIVPSNPGGFPNFYIDRTDPGGIFAPGFSKEYYVFGEYKCSTVPQARFMAGTDVIEAPSSALGGAYAMAGAFEHGVFYNLLDANGNLIITTSGGIAQGFYPFPKPTKRATRPIIVASSNPNEYIICGSYEVAGINTMYVLNIPEAGGVPNFSMIYNYPGNGSSVYPADMILSPYSPFGLSEVVIVGQITNAYGGVGSGDRGFIIRLDVNSLNALSPAILYGQPAGTGVDAFSSITTAFSGSSGGNGFAIGGRTDINPGAGFLWTLKVDPTGSVPYWNTLTQPLIDPNASDIVAIKERFSAVNGTYEYYCAAICAKGMMVMKLDDNGIPFGGGNNEFVYYGAFSQPSVVRDLSYLDNGGPNDIGIHVYGTEDGVTGGFHHFVEAAFNGVSGACQSWQVSGAPSSPGPTDMFFHDMIIQPGLKYCPVFRMIVRALNTAPKILCDDPNLPPGGDNSRMALATGISAQQGSDHTFRVSPNPVTDKLEIRYTASQSDVVDIRLYDYLGRLVQSVPVTGIDSGNDHIAGLDPSTLNIESGIYIIHTTINGVSNQQKIIYTKGQ